MVLCAWWLGAMWSCCCAACGSRGLALLSLCAANSLLPVQCKRCFLALLKPRQSQWMQLNIVKKASVFTMLLSLNVFNSGLMELVILTKMNSITLLIFFFFLHHLKEGLQREWNRGKTGSTCFQLEKWTVGWVKNMMDHQAYWVLVKVHLVDKAWSIDIINKTCIDIINKTWSTSHKQLGDSHWPWCWSYFLSSAWGKECNFRKYGDSTKLEGGIDLLNGKDSRRMEIIVMFKKVHQKSRTSAHDDPLHQLTWLTESHPVRKDRGCDGHHMECTWQNDTQEQGKLPTWLHQW